MKNIYLITSLLLQVVFAFGQSYMSPAAPQNESILITGATIHVGDQSVIENGAIGFSNGKIDYVGVANMGDLPSYNKTINATGKHIYPGLIAPNNQLGLVEVAAVKATNDKSDLGIMKPHIRSIIAYNTDSYVIPTVRNMGVLLSEVTPTGGTISGTSSIVQLDAWNWEDAVYKMDIGIHLNWPNKYKRTGWWAEPGPIKANKKYEEKLNSLKNYFVEAKAYGTKKNHLEKNIRKEALAGLFNGSKKLFIHVNDAAAIIESVEFGIKNGIEVVLVGAYDSYLILDYLKEKNVSIVLSSTQALPFREDDDIDMNYKLPTILSQAGINFAFGHEGFWQMRNFAYQAGQACGFGLDKEAAIEALTLNAAKIFNIDDKTGSLTKGKDANIIVVNGDILNMKESTLSEAFIQGRMIDLNNNQKVLYEKYKEKYKGK